MDVRCSCSLRYGMLSHHFPMHQTNGFEYIDEGPRDENPPVVLLHGMLGDLSNWSSTVETLPQNGFRVVAPVLPVYELPLRKTNLSGLVDYLHNFLNHLDIEQAVLAGNSLGGHLALLYTLDYPEAVSALVLAGASGIYEVNIGTSTPRRRDREFVRERTELTFYDSSFATDELVDEMYDLINDRPRVLRLIRMARSAESEIVTDRLPAIEVDTLLVWGKNDKITPPDVAEAFQKRLPKAELHFVDRCGHAPMIERPNTFNRLLVDFLDQTVGETSPSSPVST